MKVLYNGKVCFEVATSHSLTLKEALYCHGIDADDRDDLEAAYKNGEPFVGCEEDYFIDWEGLEAEE